MIPVTAQTLQKFVVKVMGRKASRGKPLKQSPKFITNNVIPDCTTLCLYFNYSETIAAKLETKEIHF